MAVDIILDPEPDRKSVDGGFSFFESKLIDGWGAQRWNHALSSNEAEYTAIVNGSVRGLRLAIG